MVRLEELPPVCLKWTMRYLLMSGVLILRSASYKCTDYFRFKIYLFYQNWNFFQSSKFVVYAPFNSQGHIRTGPQHCHLLGSKQSRSDRL